MFGMRREILVNDAVYHVFTKSIAGYRIFTDDRDFRRMADLLVFYRMERPPARFSTYIALKDKSLFEGKYCTQKDNLVSLIAYCIMPTHLHIALKQLKTGGISAYLGNALNSYTRYFNTRSGRKGPLWQSRFRHVAVETDEQLMHLTRYIHLNPVTEHLVEDPAAWEYSSYREYMGESGDRMCTQDYTLSPDPSVYRDFVLDQIDYQRSLARMKSLHLE